MLQVAGHEEDSSCLLEAFAFVVDADIRKLRAKHLLAGALVQLRMPAVELHVELAVADNNTDQLRPEALHKLDGLVDDL